MLSKEQIIEIKKQLFKQLEQWPESQRKPAKKQIEEMNNQQLEEFLIKNNMIKPSEQTTPQTTPQQSKQQSPFRLIAEGKIPSYKIDENKTAIAVLEINPISKGHAIVIPKIPVTSDKLPTQSFTLAKKIAKKIKSKFKPKAIEIITSELFGEAIINILPIYENENIESQRKKADEKQLEEIQKKLEVKHRQKKPKKIELKKLPKAPIRVP